MAVSFDPLDTCGPTSRRYTPGQYPTKRFNSISGAGTTRLYGSKAFDARLELSLMLKDDDVCAVMKCWHDAKGTYDTITLPPEFLVGSSDLLDCSIPDYLNWRWAEEPSVESVLPGRSRVQINLIATLDS